MSTALGLTVLVIVLGTVLEWALGVHHLPGGPALAGAVGCVAIVVVSKALGKWWLQRPESDDE